MRDCSFGTGILAMAVLWIVLPACFIVGLYNVLGPDPMLLYLAAVMLFPPILTLLGPVLRVLPPLPRRIRWRLPKWKRKAPTTPAQATPAGPPIPTLWQPTPAQGRTDWRQAFENLAARVRLEEVAIEKLR